MRRGGEFYQVLIPRVVFGEQRQVIALVVDLRFFLKSAPVGHVCFDADDRLDAVLHALGIKFDGAVHGTVVGKADRRHAVFFCEQHHVVYFRQTVEQRVVAMRMEMDK